jgi:hypothetical protein
MQTKTAQRSNEKYVRRSLQDYLEGQQNLKWIAGVIRGGQADVAAVREMLADLPNYGLPGRRSELSDWLDSPPK